MTWLESELAARLEQAVTASSDQRSGARRNLVQKLEDWKRDPDLAGVRGGALDGLEPAERSRWRTLWAAVEQALNKAKSTPN